MQQSPIALIQIVGTEILPNIYDVFLLKPETIISWKTQQNSSVGKLAKIIELLAPQAQHHIIEDHSELFKQISNLKKHGYRVIVNITGGKKHQALLLCEFIQNKYPAFYLDQTCNKFVDVGTTAQNTLFVQHLQGSLPPLHELLDIKDLLCIYFDTCCAEDQNLLQKYRELYAKLSSAGLVGALNNLILAEKYSDTERDQFCEKFTLKYPEYTLNNTTLLQQLHFAVALNEQMQGLDNPQAKVFFHLAQIDALVYINGAFYCMGSTLAGKNQRPIPNLIKFIEAAAQLDSFAAKKSYYCTGKHALEILAPVTEGHNIELTQICTNSRAVLVQFVGTIDNHHNMLDALRLKPDIIIHFHSQKSALQQKNLQQALQVANLKSTIFACEITSTTDMQSFAGQLQSTLDKYTYPRYHLHFNLTGGTKLFSREMYKYAKARMAGIYLMGEDGKYFAMNAAGKSSLNDYQQQLNRTLETAKTTQIISALAATRGYQVLFENKDNWRSMALNHPSYHKFAKDVQDSLQAISAEQTELSQDDIIRFQKHSPLSDELTKRNIIERIPGKNNHYKVCEPHLSTFNTIFLGGIAWEKELQAALKRTKQIGNYTLLNDSFFNGIEWNNQEMKERILEEDFIGLDENYKMVLISCKLNFRDKPTLIQNIVEHAARTRTLGGKNALAMLACKNILELPQDELEEVLEIAAFHQTTLLYLEGQPTRVQALTLAQVLPPSIEIAGPI